MVNVPSLPLLTVTLAPVLSSVTVICAFGTTAPCGSNTVPVMEPRCTCAAAKETASQKITATLSLMCFPLSERANLDDEKWDQHITGPIHSATLLHTTSRCRTPVSKDGKYNYPVNRALRFALELEKVTLFSYYDSTLSSDSPQISKLWRVRVFTQSSSRLPVLSSLNSSKQPSAFEASPTKNNLREALYYQVFDRFEPPVNPPCSASRSTAVFHVCRACSIARR